MHADIATIESGASRAPGAPSQQAASRRVNLSIADAFELIAKRALVHIRSNEVAFGASGDSEALHQIRVALRQLLTALWIFRPVLADNDFSRAIARDLRQLNEELGAVRDLDVCIAESRAGSKEHSWLTRRRSRLCRIALNEQQSSNRQRVYSRSIEWMLSREWRSGTWADSDARSLVTGRLNRLWRKILKFGGKPSKLGRHRRHRLRIEIKTLRYSLDFLQLPLSPAEIDPEQFGPEVQALQKTLGKLNDLENRRDLRASAGLRPKRYRGAKRKQARRAKRSLRTLRGIGPCWEDRHV